MALAKSYPYICEFSLHVATNRSISYENDSHNYTTNNTVSILTVSLWFHFFLIAIYIINICFLCVLLFLVTILWCCRRWYSGRASSGHQPFQTYSYTMLRTKIIFSSTVQCKNSYTNTKLGKVVSILSQNCLCIFKIILILIHLVDRALFLVSTTSLVDAPVHLQVVLTWCFQL